MMNVSVDFHTHILPCMDDGSASTAMSLEMLEREAAQGIETVVLTPHFYPHRERPESFLKRREESVALLRDAMDGRKGFPNIIVGAEVHYFEGISDCDYLQQLKIEDTDTVMIEMPLTNWSKRMLSELCDIGQKQNLTPIVAHIDRYIGVFRSCVQMDDLAELPVYVQASSDFFTRLATKKKALRMLRDGMMHVLGSDCHNLTSRPPNMGNTSEFIKHRLGSEAIEYINSFENKILNK